MKKILVPLLFTLSFVVIKAQIPQAPIIFNTIEQMMNTRTSYTVAKVNDALRGGIFTKVPKGALVIDSGIVMPSIDSNFVWVRDISESFGLHTKWFCKRNGVTDDADNMQRAIYAAQRTRFSRVVIDNGKYLVGKSIHIPYGVTVEGDATDSVRIIPSASGKFFEINGTKDSCGFVFLVNIDTTTMDWKRSTPNMLSGNIGNFLIDGSATKSISGVLTGSSGIVHDIQVAYGKTAVAKIERYLDKLEITRIHAQAPRADTTSYFIFLNGNGDAVNVSTIASSYYGAYDSIIAKGVYIRSSRGGVVFGLINGRHYFQNTQNLEVTTCHIEGGSMTFDNASAYVHNNAFWTGDSIKSPITAIRTNTSSVNGFELTIVNNVFASYASFSGGWGTNEYPDVAINTPNALVTLENNRREGTFPVEDSVQNNVFGIYVGDSSGVWADWRSYSPILSIPQTTSSNGRTVVTATNINNIYAYSGIVAATKTDRDRLTHHKVLWRASSGNYHYNMVLLTDPIRGIGRAVSSSDVVVNNLVNGQDSIIEMGLLNGNIKRSGGFIARLYRGTTANQYSKYVDLPFIQVNRIWDNGVSVCNFPWKDRTTSGVDTVVNIMASMTGVTSYTDGIASITANYIPAFNSLTTMKGTWKQGDKVRFYNPFVTSSGYSFYGLNRLTSGSGNVLGTDWQKVYIANDSTYKFIDINGDNTDSLVVLHSTDNSLRKIAPLTTLASGAFTSTLTNTTNISSSTFNSATYSRNGSVVHVRISGTITPTAAASATLTFTLPVTTTTTTQSNAGKALVDTGVGLASIVSGTTGTLLFTASGTSTIPFVIEMDYVL